MVRSRSRAFDLLLLDEVARLALRAASFEELATGLTTAAAAYGCSIQVVEEGGGSPATAGPIGSLVIPVRLSGIPCHLVVSGAPTIDPVFWGLVARITELGLARTDAEEHTRITVAHEQRSEARGHRLEVIVESERRRATQLHVLNELAITLNGEADPGRMMDEVLAGALQLTGALGGSFYLVERDDLRLHAFTTSPDLASRLPHPRQSGVDVKELAREAVVTQKLVRSRGAGYDPAGYSGAYLAVPLTTADGEVLACLVLAGAPGDAGFTAEDEMLAATLAAHTTVALQNGQRLAREHRVAEYLQQSMLPTLPHIPGVEIDVAYESATDATLVGGDFFDVIPLKRNRTAVVVGDVCGKGLRAATRMAAVRHTLRAYAVLDPDPGKWLTLVNESLASGPESAEFVTVALVVVDPIRRSLEYVLAGHPGPLVASAGGVIELGGAHDLPLGVDDGQRYRAQLTQVPDDSTLILFTDGLYEARSGTHMFGTLRLEAAARAVAVTPLHGSADRLVAEARAFSGGHLADDVVVMLVRLTGR
jgi:serine phosphatase RsbU (regulator of sigma subunit)